MTLHEYQFHVACRLGYPGSEGPTLTTVVTGHDGPQPLCRQRHKVCAELGRIEHSSMTETVLRDMIVSYDDSLRDPFQVDTHSP